MTTRRFIRALVIASIACLLTASIQLACKEVSFKTTVENQDNHLAVLKDTPANKKSKERKQVAKEFDPRELCKGTSLFVTMPKDDPNAAGGIACVNFLGELYMCYTPGNGVAPACVLSADTFLLPTGTRFNTQGYEDQCTSRGGKFLGVAVESYERVVGEDKETLLHGVSWCIVRDALTKFKGSPYDAMNEVATSYSAH